MKNLKLTSKLAVVGAVACLTLASASATTVTLSVYGPTGNASDVTADNTGDHVLGAVNPGAPASDASDQSYINGILLLALGGGPSTVGADQVYRSLNVFSGLPASAAVDTASGADGPGNQTTITLLAGVSFLVGKYDGPNGGSEVWYVGNLAAGTQVTIPQNAFGNANGQYGLSGTVQLLGSEAPPTIPDGGSTLVLLGIAGLGLFAFVRKTRTA